MEHSQRRWHRQPAFFLPASRETKVVFHLLPCTDRKPGAPAAKQSRRGSKILTRPRGQNVVTVSRTFINPRDYTAEWGRPVTRQAV